MKETAFNKAEQILNELDVIEDIQPSAEWKEALMDKIYASKRSLKFILPSTKLILIILFIVLINVGYIIGTVINSSKHDIHRNNVLQVISKEFLINPTSINN